MKLIRTIKAYQYKFIDYPDKNGSCFIKLPYGKIEIHTASKGNWTVSYETGKVGELGSDLKVFDTLEDAKQYAVELADKWS